MIVTIVLVLILALVAFVFFSMTPEGKQAIRKISPEADKAKSMIDTTPEAFSLRENLEENEAGQAEGGTSQDETQSGGQTATQNGAANGSGVPEQSGVQSSENLPDDFVSQLRAISAATYGIDTSVPSRNRNLTIRGDIPIQRNRGVSIWGHNEDSQDWTSSIRAIDCWSKDGRLIAESGECGLDPTPATNPQYPIYKP